MRFGLKHGCLVLMFCAAALAPAGCGKFDGPAAGPAKPVPATPVSANVKHHDHSGWWCDEHGVPESICAQCNARLAAEFKKKGDWCAEHDCPRSQCFRCDPGLKEEFAAQYRAKYGKEPPLTEDEAAKEEKANRT